MNDTNGPPIPIENGEQIALFDLDPPWRVEWNGMPEFSQEDQAPSRSLTVHFETAQDVDQFAELVRQPIGENTKSVWFPEADIVRMSDKRYADE